MSLLIKHFYRFGAFTLDTDQRVLFLENKPLPLTPKVFDTLLILVENKGRIVEKDDLMNRLWPDTFVEEANLTFNIKQIRKLLGDDARQPVYVETVSRRGYRFIANVEEVLTEDSAGQITQRFESDREGVPAPQNIETGTAGPQDQPLPDALAAPTKAPPASMMMSAESTAAIEAPPDLPPAFTAKHTTGKSKTKGVILFLVLSLMLVAAVVLFYFLLQSGKSPLVSGYFQNVKLRSLTNIGNTTAAAISPDGKFISYAVSENGKNSLWTKAIATGSAVEIVPPGEFGIITSTFSPDGDYVYYVVMYKGFRTVLYRIPVLGGKPTQI